MNIPVQMADYDILAAWYVSGATSSDSNTATAHIEMMMMPTTPVFNNHAVCPQIFEVETYYANAKIRTATAKHLDSVLDGTWHYVAIKYD